MDDIDLADVYGHQGGRTNGNDDEFNDYEEEMALLDEMDEDNDETINRG